MKHAPIFDTIEKWSERKIDGKRFNEVFQVDGIPVWYFLEPLLKGAYLPRPFKTLAETEEYLKSKKSPKSSLKLKLTQFVLRKGLWLNERIKWLISSSKAVKTGEKDVLFLGYTNQVVRGKRGELKPIEFSNVVHDLKRGGAKPLVLFCDPISANSFRGLLKFPDLLYSYVDSKTIKESKRLSRELNREWEKISDKKKAALFTFNGKSYWRFLKDEMNFLFSREMLATLITYYLTFKKVIKEHRIKVIYLTALGGFYESILLGVAYNLNKKVVHSPHGYGGRYFIVRDEFLENVHFAAWGSEEKKRLLQLGIKKENISITGSPLFDEIAEFKLKKENKTEKTITLLPTALVEYKLVGRKEYFDYIRRYLTQVSKVKDVKKVIIKLHPDEKYRSEYESIAKSLQLTNVKILQKSGKKFLYAVLRDSDLLTSFGLTTTDLEGLMLDKNVIIIDGLRKDPLAELAKKDKYREAATVIDKNDDLTSTIMKILTDRNLQRDLERKRRRYIATSFYRIDGKAHERVANLLTKLCKSGA